MNIAKNDPAKFINSSVDDISLGVLSSCGIFVFLNAYYDRLDIIIALRGANMLSKIPIDFSKVAAEDVNKEILRLGVIAELDAISLYEQMAALTDNNEVKRVLLDVAKEEKTHVGEFQTLLLKEDEQQDYELKMGKKEVEEKLEK